MNTNKTAANMLLELLDSDEEMGPTLRVRLERTLSVLRGQALPHEERPEDRRANSIKRRIKDGLRAASGEELAELSGALRLAPDQMQQVLDGL